MKRQPLARRATGTADISDAGCARTWCRSPTTGPATKPSCCPPCSACPTKILRIADFAKAGGTVIVGYATGLIDEHFHIGFGGYPGAGNGLLRDMLGIRSEEFNILGEEAEDEPAEIGLSNGLTTRLWQNDVTSVAATPQCLPLRR